MGGTNADCLIVESRGGEFRLPYIVSLPFYDMLINVITLILRCETCKLLIYVLAGRILADRQQALVPTLMFEWLARLIFMYL